MSDTSELKTLLYSLVTSPLPVASLTIWDTQNAARPELPYWTLRLGSIRKVGTDTYSSSVDNVGDGYAVGTREATLSVQCLGGSDPEIACSDLRDMLMMPSMQERWLASEIALYRVGDVQVVPYLMDNGHWEPRAAMDLFIRFGVHLTENMGLIEIADIDGNFIDHPQISGPFQITL